MSRMRNSRVEDQETLDTGAFEFPCSYTLFPFFPIFLSDVPGNREDLPGMGLSLYKIREGKSSSSASLPRLLPSLFLSFLLTIAPTWGHWGFPTLRSQPGPAFPRNMGPEALPPGELLNSRQNEEQVRIDSGTGPPASYSPVMASLGISLGKIPMSNSGVMTPSMFPNMEDRPRVNSIPKKSTDQTEAPGM